MVPHPSDGRGVGEVQAVAASHHERRPPEHLRCVGDVVRTFTEVYFLNLCNIIYIISLHNFKKLLNVLIKIQLRFLRQRYKYFKIYKFDWKYATQKSSYHKLCRTITTVKKFTRLILKLSITLDLILLYIFKIFLCDKTHNNTKLYNKWIQQHRIRLLSTKLNI